MAMVAVTVALISFFAFVILRVTTPQMTTLFTDLSPEDSSGVVKELERQAIPFELRNEGAAILVPKDKVTRLRMKLAEGGLPKGGGVGYEIFDKADAQPGRGDRIVGGRDRPGPCRALGRLRLQQDHPDLGPLRSRRTRAALEPNPRGILRHRRQ